MTDFRDDNFPPVKYPVEIAIKIKLRLYELIKEVKTNVCPSCGKELQFNYVDMYDHEYGWGIIPEIPKQWLSVRCHNCKYDVSLNKIGVGR